MELSITQRLILTGAADAPISPSGRAEPVAGRYAGHDGGPPGLMADADPAIPPGSMTTPPAAGGDLAELARRCAETRGGDRAAFEQLHTRLAPGIRGFFTRRSTGGRALEQSDELTQRVMIALFEAIAEGRYDPQRSAVSTFTYAIASNIWLRHLRERRARGGVVSDNDLDRAEEDARSLGLTGGPLDHAASAELLEAVRRCLRERGGPGNLTEDEHTIVLAAAAGASDRALAERLGLAASTINAKKQSGWEKLRRALSRMGFRGEVAERGEGERE
jgi:RNA polymerase sigma factor (sigma-70 family)